MKKLITLRGNSGSGKTTIARALQEKFGKNTMLLSQDVIRRDILKTNDGAGTRANDVLIMLLEYGHAHNELVILEGILNTDGTPRFSMPQKHSTAKTSARTILTSRLRRRSAATKRRTSARSSAKRKCAAGGTKRTTPPH